MAGLDSTRFRYQPGRSTPSYGDAEYWVARYEANPEPFEWYLRWHDLKAELADGFPPESRVLVLGCGSSSLGEQLFAEGHVVTNVDVCEPIVRKMSERQSMPKDGTASAAPSSKKGAKAASPEPPPVADDRPPMQYEVADAQGLPQDWANRFDVVIDKAMLDAVACGHDGWKSCAAVLQSVSAVLKPSTGVYICVSHAGPKLRVPMLTGSQAGGCEGYGWELRHQAVCRPLRNPAADPKAKDRSEFTPSPAYSAEDSAYHIYVCQKL